MVERQVKNVFAVYSKKRTTRRNHKPRRAGPCGWMFQRSGRNSCHSGKWLKTCGRCSLGWCGLEVCSPGILCSLLAFGIPLLNLVMARTRHSCASLLSWGAVPGVCCWSQHCCVHLTQGSNSIIHQGININLLGVNERNVVLIMVLQVLRNGLAEYLWLVSYHWSFDGCCVCTKHGCMGRLNSFACSNVLALACFENKLCKQENLTDPPTEALLHTEI